MSTSLLQALATVHFGDLSTDAFLNATQAGRPVDAPGPLAVRSTGQERLQACLAAPDGRLIWEGPIPRSEKPGRFFIVNPYATNLLKHTDPEELAVGYGLTADKIGEISGVFVEVDEALDGGRLAIEEQARIYDQIEADTGLRFTTAVLSGDHRESAKAQLAQEETLEVGKSLHVVIATRWQGAGPEALKLRQEATDALCAIAGADPLVRDVARKQRVGGVVARLDGKVRVQTCIRADSTAVFDLQDVRDRLVAYAASLGINVQVRLEAMHTAFQCRQKAKAWVKAAEQGNVSTFEADEAAKDLRDLALEIRVSGVVLPSQRKLMGIIGVPKGQVAVTTQSGATRVVSTGHGEGWDHETTILTHTSGQEGTAAVLCATLKRQYRVPDVHCINHADAHASAFLTEWKGGYTLICPSCGKIPSSPKFGGPVRALTGSQAGVGGTQAPQGEAVFVHTPPPPGSTKIKIATPEELEARHQAQLGEDKAREEARAYKAKHDPLEVASRLHLDLLAKSDDVLDHVADERGALFQIQIMQDISDDPVCDEIARVIHTSIDLECMNNPRKLVDGEITIDEALVELALKRYAEKGCDCPYGPVAARAHHGGMHMWRLACRRRTCEVCGPRWRRAERAAIYASIATLGDDWLGGSIVENDGDDPQFRKWAGKDMTKRCFLRVRFSPTEIITLLFWAPGHEPSTRTEKRLVRIKFVRDWADTIADQIIETVQPGPDQQAVSGTPALTRRINLLKETLLGRKNKAAKEKTFITNASPHEIRERAQKNIAKGNNIMPALGATKADLKHKLSLPVSRRIDPQTTEPTPAPVITQALEDSRLFRGQGKKGVRAKVEIFYTKDGEISLVNESEPEPEPVRSTS